MQHEKGDRIHAGVQSVGIVVDNRGQVVRLSPGQSVPHMQEEDGWMIVTTPKDHPKIKGTGPGEYRHV